MSPNGPGRPPRPRIELVWGSPSADEAAALVAAIERFLAETTPPPAAGATPGSRWQRAALLEGVSGGRGSPAPWGEPRGWRCTPGPPREIPSG